MRSCHDLTVNSPTDDPEYPLRRSATMAALGSILCTRRGLALLSVVATMLWLTLHVPGSSPSSRPANDGVLATQPDLNTPSNRLPVQAQLPSAKHLTDKVSVDGDDAASSPGQGAGTGARQWLKYFPDPISRPFRNASSLWSSASEGSSWTSSFLRSGAKSGATMLENRPATYRDHLELTQSPPGYSHSRTLTFSHIYVLSLASRKDRRVRMEKLARALELDLTFVEATPPSASFLRWIAERVHEVRQRKATLLSQVDSEDGIQDPRKTGQGGAVASPWLLAAEDVPGASELKDARWGNTDWVSYLLGLTHSQRDELDADEGFDMEKELRDPLEPVERRQIKPSVLAMWWSHMRILNKMKKKNDRSALILEDDVDLEWDLERRWASAHRRLPETWDTVFLGHCWSSELEKPAYLHPSLHQSTRPRCLHGYAVSRKGAKTLLARLSDPWLAFQAPIDVAVPALYERGRIQSFSVEPPLIIQSHETLADVKGATSAEWRGVLADSTMERILRDEGFELKAPVWDEHNLDPALRYHPLRPIIVDAPEGKSMSKASGSKSAKGAAAKLGRPPKADPDDLETILSNADGSSPNEGVGLPLAAMPPSRPEEGRFHPDSHPNEDGTGGLGATDRSKKDDEDESPPRMKPATPKIGTGGKVIAAPKKMAPPAGVAGVAGDALGAGAPGQGLDGTDASADKPVVKVAGEGGKRIGTGKRPDAKKLADAGLAVPRPPAGAAHNLPIVAPKGKEAAPIADGPVEAVKLEKMMRVVRRHGSSAQRR